MRTLLGRVLRVKSARTLDYTVQTAEVVDLRTLASYRTGGIREGETVQGRGWKVGNRENLVRAVRLSTRFHQNGRPIGPRTSTAAPHPTLMQWISSSAAVSGTVGQRQADGDPSHLVGDSFGKAVESLLWERRNERFPSGAIISIGRTGSEPRHRGRKAKPQGSQKRAAFLVGRRSGKQNHA